MKSLFLLLFFILNAFVVFPQKIHISEVIKDNDLTAFDNQKLILIDFWATWCEPCIPAAKQLEVYQQEKPQKIFMISLSDESGRKISNFLERHYNRMMVATDLDQISFSGHQVRSRPYAVIINLNGKVVWKGHPSGINTSLIDKLYNENKHLNTNSLKEVIEISEISEVREARMHFQLELGSESDGESLFSDEYNLSFSGRLNNLVGFLFEKPDFQIKIKESDNIRVHYSSPETDKTKRLEEFETYLKNNLGYEIVRKTKTVKAREIIIEDVSLLWDIGQIDKETDFPSFMITEDRIQMDNTGFGMLARMLTQLKDEFYYYPDPGNLIYDWDFHYKYDEFMIEELKHSFGIGFSEPQKTKVEILEIRKLSSQNPE